MKITQKQMISLQWGRAVEGAETIDMIRAAGKRLYVLQWGRAVEGAETHTPVTRISGVWSLQWGRAVEGAETTEGILSAERCTRFNGAAPLKARKPLPSPP